MDWLTDNCCSYCHSSYLSSRSLTASLYSLLMCYLWSTTEAVCTSLWHVMTAGEILFLVAHVCLFLVCKIKWKMSQLFSWTLQNRLAAAPSYWSMPIDLRQNWAKICMTGIKSATKFRMLWSTTESCHPVNIDKELLAMEYCWEMWRRVRSADTATCVSHATCPTSSVTDTVLCSCQSTAVGYGTC